MINIIIPKGLSQGVIASQIVKFANQLNKFTEVQILHQFETEMDIESRSEIDCKLKKFDTVLLSRMFGSDWVYIRDIYTFTKVYLLKKIFGYNFKIFYDFRGLLYEESWYKKRNKLKKKILFQLEKFAYKKANGIGAVSNNLQNFLNRKFGKRDIYVTPCCIESVSFIETPKKSIQNKKLKFIYVGGTSKWQRLEDTLCFFKKLTSDINACLTIVTKEKEYIANLVKAIELENVEIKSLSPSKVAEELRKHDFGFLLRHDVIMNNVSSPIKFLEYTSNGVIPILSKGIGDYSEEVEKKNIGIIIDENNLSGTINRIKALCLDNNIQQRLYEYSLAYIWSNYLIDHPLLKANGLVQNLQS